jgi:hypothetical protein
MDREASAQIDRLVMNAGDSRAKEKVWARKIGMKSGHARLCTASATDSVHVILPDTNQGASTE